jgi:hypothetical protein
MTVHDDVLRLPEVPDNAVALIGERRWIRSAGAPGRWKIDNAQGLHVLAGLGSVLDSEPEGVRVELAPTGPRTWSKVDTAPVLDDPPQTLEVKGQRWYLVDQSGGRYYRPGGLVECTIQQLRESGDVTEVLDLPKPVTRH